MIFIDLTKVYQITVTLGKVENLADPVERGALGGGMVAAAEIRVTRRSCSRVRSPRYNARNTGAQASGRKRNRCSLSHDINLAWFCSLNSPAFIAQDDFQLRIVPKPA